MWVMSLVRRAQTHPTKAVRPEKRAVFQKRKASVLHECDATYRKVQGKRGKAAQRDASGEEQITMDDAGHKVSGANP